MFGFGKSKQAPAVPAAEETARPQGLFARLKAGLARTRANLGDALGDLLSGSRQIDDDGEGVRIRCRCRVNHRTGVEMEALTGASVAALTVYDMCKALSHEIEIRETRLVSKRGGKSDYARG